MCQVGERARAGREKAGTTVKVAHGTCVPDAWSKVHFEARFLLHVSVLLFLILSAVKTRDQQEAYPPLDPMQEQTTECKTNQQDPGTSSLRLLHAARLTRHSDISLQGPHL